MAKPHSLVDHIYYENRKDYTHVEGDIAYLDAAPLRRPFEMPRAQRIIALVIIIAAVVLGLLFLNNTRICAKRPRQNRRLRKTSRASPLSKPFHK